jgi:hypothetical protein
MWIDSWIIQYTFQFCFKLWCEQVLNGIRIIVYVIGRDVQLGGEIQFPQAVDLHHALRTGSTFLRQL